MEQNFQVNAKFRYIYFFLILLIGIGVAQYKDLIVVHIFAVVYLFLIFKYFSHSSRKTLYYSTLLFSVMGFALTFRINERYGIYYFYFTLFIYMINLLISLIKSKSYKKVIKLLKDNKYARFLTVFLIYLLISITWASSKKMAITTAINYISMISLLVMIIIENNSREEFKSTLKFLEYIYIGILALGFVQIFGFRYGLKNSFDVIPGIYEKIPYLKRIPQVFFYNPNNYGVVVTLAMVCLFVGYLYSSTKGQKTYYIILLIASQINLIFSKCRTAWITLVLFIVFSIILAIIYRRKELIKGSAKIFLLVTIIFVGLSILPQMTPYYDKFNGTPILKKLNIKNFNEPAIPDGEIVSFGEKGSINVRYTLMINVVNGVFKEKHIFGFGVGNTSDYMQKLGNTHDILSVHSLWFEILGDFGVFIFMYFVYICFSIFIEFFKKMNKVNREIEKYSFMGSIICFSLVPLVFTPSSVVAFTPFWIFLALVYTLKKIVKLED